MRSRFQRIFAAFLLSACLGAPLLETFDRWDNTLQDGNDTEANLIVVALCVGVGFVAAVAVIRRLCPVQSSTFGEIAQHVLDLAITVSGTFPTPHPGPPTVLRV
jgi:hypothetical protein